MTVERLWTHDAVADRCHGLNAEEKCVGKRAGASILYPFGVPEIG